MVRNILINIYVHLILYIYLIVGSRNGSLFNETFRRPFGGRLFEKQLFRSYIQKKKLIQLLENETISENESTTTTSSSSSSSDNNNNNNNELDSDSSTALSIINDYNKNSITEYSQEELSILKLLIFDFF